MPVQLEVCHISVLLNILLNSRVKARPAAPYWRVLNTLFLYSNVTHSCYCKKTNVVRKPKGQTHSKDTGVDGRMLYIKMDLKWGRKV
jgi:hypothetical protein